MDAYHEEKRTAGCNGKKRFETYREASRAADRPSKRGSRSRKVGREPYKCRYCDGFHVGTPRKYKQRGYEE